MFHTFNHLFPITMKLKLLFSLAITFGCVQLGVSQNYLVSYNLLATDQSSSFKPLVAQAKYDVKTYKVTYNTTDVDGTPAVASGAVIIPMASDCDSLPILSYGHGTILEREDVPSRNNQEATVVKVGASVGAVGVAPDYLGLGDNQGLHPYLHAESEATATIDLIRAAREMLDSLQIGHNGEVFITGYSQGGHAAMATAKYIQDNNLLGEFNVIGAGPASGPYHLSGTQADVLLSNQPYSNPGYVCYLFFAMQRVYGNVYSSYSALLKPPYDTQIPPYFDGTYDMSAVNAVLPNTLSSFIQDSVLLNFKNDSVGRTHPIWQFLLANDNYDWSPQFPMELYYCTQDEQVDYQNSIIARDSMNAKGAASVTAVNQGAYNHGVCAVPALQASLAFFLSKQTGCGIGLDEWEYANVSIYPNPAKDYFTVEGLEDPVAIDVINSAGVVVRQETIKPGETVHISAFTPGLYVIKLEVGQHILTKKILKQ